jgi:hypothetical protein
MGATVDVVVGRVVFVETDVVVGPVGSDVLGERGTVLLDVVELVVVCCRLLDVVVTVVVVVGETSERAATALSRPAPASASRPRLSISTAPPWRAARKACGVSVGTLWRSSAATAAECGAAADVPKNRQDGGH